MIRLTFEAATWSELAEQLRDMAGQAAAMSRTTGNGPRTVQDDRKTMVEELLPLAEPHSLATKLAPAADQVAVTPICPDHRRAMEFRAAGTSKRTGKPYSAFYSCQEDGCRRTVDAAAV